MTRFQVRLTETRHRYDRVDTLNADHWYVDNSGALIFVGPPTTFGGEQKIGAFGPRMWESVSVAEE